MNKELKFNIKVGKQLYTTKCKEVYNCFLHFKEVITNDDSFRGKQEGP